jgi:hypothetical protein
MKLEFSIIFEKKIIHVPNFMKIRPVVAQLFREGGQTDGRTDITKLEVAFRNFPNTSTQLRDTVHYSRQPYVRQCLVFGSHFEVPVSVNICFERRIW